MEGGAAMEERKEVGDRVSDRGGAICAICANRRHRSYAHVAAVTAWRYISRKLLVPPGTAGRRC